MTTDRQTIAEPSKTMKPKHYCGIFGSTGSSSPVHQVFKGLFALQHRGQESAGITSSDGERFYEHKGMGLVSNVFNAEILDRLKGKTAIGHVRYSTTGESSISNAQPLSIVCKRGEIAIAHNGNLTNTDELRNGLTERGSVFQTTTDSEIILHLLAISENELEPAIMETMSLLQGAYSLLIMTKDKLTAVRDPYGFRPLVIGRRGENWLFASETCALDAVSAEFVREVEPGEIVTVHNGNLHSLHFNAKRQDPTFCIFETVYFARPDSIMFGRSVASIRTDFGRGLAEEHPIQADMVIPIPDSGNYAAEGYSCATGIPFKMAFVRNHYTGRSFINPDHGSRPVVVNMKLNLIGEMVRGKRVIVVDDSIVRGTTSGERCHTIKAAGAKEVHMLVSCPPHRHPCIYGIDFPDRQKLFANRFDVTNMAKELGLDSLGYLSEAGMVRAIGASGFCLACFNGKYPTGTAR